MHVKYLMFFLSLFTEHPNWSSQYALMCNVLHQPLQIWEVLFSLFTADPIFGKMVGNKHVF